MSNRGDTSSDGSRARGGHGGGGSRGGGRGSGRGGNRGRGGGGPKGGSDQAQISTKDNTGTAGRGPRPQQSDTPPRNRGRVKNQGMARAVPGGDNSGGASGSVGDGGGGSGGARGDGARGRGRGGSNLRGNKRNEAQQGQQQPKAPKDVRLTAAVLEIQMDGKGYASNDGSKKLKVSLQKSNRDRILQLNVGQTSVAIPLAATRNFSRTDVSHSSATENELVTKVQFTIAENARRFDVMNPEALQGSSLLDTMRAIGNSHGKEVCVFLPKHHDRDSWFDQENTAIRIDRGQVVRTFGTWEGYREYHDGIMEMAFESEVVTFKEQAKKVNATFVRLNPDDEKNKPQYRVNISFPDLNADDNIYGEYKTDGVQPKAQGWYRFYWTDEKYQRWKITGICTQEFFAEAMESKEFGLILLAEDFRDPECFKGVKKGTVRLLPNYEARDRALRTHKLLYERAKEDENAAVPGSIPDWEYLLGNKNPPTLFSGTVSDLPPSYEPFFNRYNQEQMQAAVNAHRSPTGWTLIEAGPGTGKSFWLATYVLAKVAHGERVVVVADSNKAVDSVMKKVVELKNDLKKHSRVPFRPVRILSGTAYKMTFGEDHGAAVPGSEAGLSEWSTMTEALDQISLASTELSPEKILADGGVSVLSLATEGDRRDAKPVGYMLSPSMEDYVVEKMMSHENIDTSGRYRELQPKLANGTITGEERTELASVMLKLEEYIFHGGNIFFMTTAVAGGNRVQGRLGKIDTVCQDEAGMSIESLSMAAWVVSKFVRNIILIGDSKQLPPVLGNLYNIRALTYSVFERLQARGFPPVRLVEQFRMSPDISYLPNMLGFYRPALRDCNGVLPMRNKERRDAMDVLARVFKTEPTSVVFLDTGSTQEDRTGSRSIINQREARFIAKAIKKMISVGNVKHDSIFTIATYKAQVDEIGLQLEKESLVKNRKMEQKAGTVDSYQGEEADYIFLSLTRSNKKGTVGFVRNPRRLNVALTRARFGLVVVGDWEMFFSGGFGDDKLKQQNADLVKIAEYCRRWKANAKELFGA